MKSAFFVTIAATLTSALVLLLAGCCCGGGDGANPCEANLKYTQGNFSKSKPFKGWGTGKTKAEAETNACWNYCYDADPDFEGKFQIWMDSTAVGKRHKKRKAGPDKKWAIIEDKKGIREEFDVCVAQCEDNAPKKKHGLSVQSSCK